MKSERGVQTPKPGLICAELLPICTALIAALHSSLSVGRQRYALRKHGYCLCVPSNTQPRTSSDFGINASVLQERNSEQPSELR